jgi:hypothetical protein
MGWDAEIIVSHVAGSRMIAQGMDGVSRGLLTEGVTTGLDMLSFVPLHLSAFERRPSLKTWISSWLGDDSEFLSPEQWFSQGHSHDGGYYEDHGFWRVKVKPAKFVWAPPPAAADVAVEELRKSLIKRWDSTHVFVCPWLMTTQWRRQLNKACVLLVFMNAGSEVWPREMCEPLTLGFVFPFLSVRPWKVRGTPKTLHLGRTMPKLLQDSNAVTGDILRKLCQQMWDLSSTPEDVVWRVLHFGSRDGLSCEAAGTI